MKTVTTLTPRTHFVQITGDLRINGRKISSARSVELLHIVANNGYRVLRSTIENDLWGGFCSRSSLWYPLKICQRADINITYDKPTRSVVLHEQVYFDYDIALNYLREGNLRAAVWILNGWPLPNHTDPYAEDLDLKLREKLASTGSDLYRSEIEEVFDILNDKSNRDGETRARSHPGCLV